jgi:glycosyltransferase involved in cell wall biosynthesis
VHAYGRLLSGARTVFAPGRDAADRIAAHFSGVEPRVQAHLEIPLATPPMVPRRRRAGEPLRVAVIGAIGPHKGFDVLLACARDAAGRHLPMTFHLVGYSCDDAALTEWGNVSIAGRYEDAALPALLAEQRCDCAFFPSVWPETYSYTLSAALAAGLHPIAFDLGVPAERIREIGWGTLIPLTPDAALVNDALLAARIGPPPAANEVRSGAATCDSVLRDYYRLTP